MDQSSSVVDVIKTNIAIRKHLGESIADIARSYETVIPGLAALMNLNQSTALHNSENEQAQKALSNHFRLSLQSSLPPSLPSVSIASKPPNAASRGFCVPLNPASNERISFSKTAADDETRKKSAVAFEDCDVEPTEHSIRSANTCDSVRENPISPFTEPIQLPSVKRRKLDAYRETSIVSPEPVLLNTSTTTSRPPRQRIGRVPFDPLADVSILKERDFATPEHAQSRLDDIAFNTLRDEFGTAWKKVHGKGQYKDWHRYIYVNPWGKKYTLESGAEEGVDFFLTPQAALEYCRRHLVQHSSA